MDVIGMLWFDADNPEGRVLPLVLLPILCLRKLLPGI